MVWIKSLLVTVFVLTLFVMCGCGNDERGRHRENRDMRGWSQEGRERDGRERDKERDKDSDPRNEERQEQRR
jgi:hypothetical protein